jgi:hypothetical protein
LGTTSYLLKHYAIKNTIKEHIKDTSLIYFSTVSVPAYIKFLQPIRNESVHGEAASLADCIALRKKMVGIGENGILCELVLRKKGLKSEKK